jgi:hypothetical protein
LLFKKSELDLWMQSFWNDQDVDFDALGRKAMEAVKELRRA